MKRKAEELKIEKNNVLTATERSNSNVQSDWIVKYLSTAKSDLDVTIIP